MSSMFHHPGSFTAKSPRLMMSIPMRTSVHKMSPSMTLTPEKATWLGRYIFTKVNPCFPFPICGVIVRLVDLLDSKASLITFSVMTVCVAPVSQTALNLNNGGPCG